MAKPKNNKQKDEIIPRFFDFCLSKNRICFNVFKRKKGKLKKL